jgi:hypothetical protein
MDMPTVHVKVDYVDYVFAKKVLKIIEEWVENLPQIESRWHFPKLQEMSLHYWWILGKLGTLSALVPCYLMLVSGQYDSLRSLAIWGLLSVGFVTFMQFIRKVAAEVVENYVDATRELSYIRLNRGDEENYEAIHAKNRSAILKAATVTG